MKRGSWPSDTFPIAFWEMNTLSRSTAVASVDRSDLRRTSPIEIWRVSHRREWPPLARARAEWLGGGAPGPSPRVAASATDISDELCSGGWQTFLFDFEFRVSDYRLNAVAEGHRRATRPVHHVSGVVVGVPYGPAVRLPADRSEQSRVANVLCTYLRISKEYRRGHSSWELIIAAAYLPPGSRCSPAPQWDIRCLCS